MKLIRAIKNTVRDGIIDEGKIPDGVKRRLKTMDPKEVLWQMKTRSLNRLKIKNKWDYNIVEDLVKDISNDVAMLYVPYYDDYDEYVRYDETWDGSDDEYEKIVKLIGHKFFSEYGSEVIRSLNKSIKAHHFFINEKYQQSMNTVKKTGITIKEQTKEDIINKLVDNDVDPNIIDDLLISLDDEDINGLVIRNLERKLFKDGDKEKNVRDYFEKYISSLSNRVQQDPNDDFDVEDEFLYGGLEPEKSKIGRKTFKKELLPLQVELLKLQEDVKKSGKAIVVVFEGRDSAGKGSTIKKMVEYLDPKYFNVIALGVASKKEREDWFGRYESQIESGKINFFDRSWYNRGIVEPVMGYSSQEDYEDFMSNVNEFEQSLIDKGVELIKFWLSITPQTQKNRFELRKSSPLKYWKFSPNDEESIDKWEEYTEYKNKVLRQTKEAKPWTVVDSNDKRAGVLNAFRHLLNVIDYEGKDVKNIGSIYPEVVTTIKEKENIEGEIPEQWSPELSQDLEAFHNIKIGESTTPHNFNKVISEAKGIDEPIRYITRTIIDIVKSQNYSNYYLPEDTTNGQELIYDFYVEYKKFGLSRSYTIPTFSIELRYESDLNMDEPYMINAALMDDDETISIVIIINPNHYPSLIYDLLADINDILAHEIEHIFQVNKLRPDSEISSSNKDEEPKGMEYYKQNHELPAERKGFERVSRLRKQTLTQVITDWFKRSKYAHQLNDEDSLELVTFLVDYYGNKHKKKIIKESEIPKSYYRRRLGNAINDETFHSLKSFVKAKIKDHLKPFNSLGYVDEYTPNLGLRMLSNPQKINQIIRLSIDRQTYELVSEFDKWGLEAGASGGNFKEIEALYQIMWDEYSEDLREYIMGYVNGDNPETITESEIPKSSYRRRLGSLITDETLLDLKRHINTIIQREFRRHSSILQDDKVRQDFLLELKDENKIIEIIRLAIENLTYEFMLKNPKVSISMSREELYEFERLLYMMLWDEYSEELEIYLITRVNEVTKVVKMMKPFSITFEPMNTDLESDNEETIKEGELPSSVRRRINIPSDIDVLNDLKKESLRMLHHNITIVDDIVNDSIKWVAEEIVPYDEDYEEQSEIYIDGVKSLLKNRFEEDIIKYVTKFMSTLNGPDTHIYTFKKHSERYGGSGFSTTFDTWDDLLKRFGYWMPLEWDEIKIKLDTKDEGQILISSPGEPTNTMNYYFSIKKMSK